MNQVKTVLKRWVRKWTTKEGLFGDYDYAYLFTPEIPFMKQEVKTQPFFGLDSDMPLFLGALLGFQHCLSMVAGIVTPPMIIATVGNLDHEIESYLVSTALIVSGLLSWTQISKIKVYGTNYHIGTGLLTVVGTSFATIPVVTKAFPLLYSNGICKTAEDGTQLPCPDGYGMLLASALICSIFEIGASFMSPKILQKIFPPIVTGPVVLLIGTSLIEEGFQNWVGGTTCIGEICTMGSHSKPWGSAEFVGLGFLVYVTIIMCERFGSPIMKSCAVIVGLFVGCVVAAGCGYFTSDAINQAKAVTFLWVHTFKLKLYGPFILPFIAVRLVLMMEAIGDITATSDVSRLEVEGPLYEGRIQGGLLCDGLNGIISGLATITPVSTFAQNNGVISITKCANRRVGYWCGFFLLMMGIFSKFAAAFISIPAPVWGGMTSFLFTSVGVSGIKIIASTEFTRRDRFVLTAVLLPGFGAAFVPNWFENVFTYSGDNTALQSFFDALVLVLETGFAIAGFIGVALNFILPQTNDQTEEINELVLETVGSADHDAREVYARKEAMRLEVLRSDVDDK
jgi:NCS2 family nucleobase:cation symporter-2